MREIAEDGGVTKSTIRDIENKKREFNREIMQNLLFKKLKEKHEKLLQSGNSEELSHQINALTNESTKNFQSLKGVTLVNAMDSLTSKFLKKKIGHEKLATYAQDAKLKKGDETNDKPTLDLRFAEMAIMKKYQECSAEIVSLRDKITTLSHQSYMLKVDIKHSLQEVS